MIETNTPEKNAPEYKEPVDDLFDELTVTELEDRLELADRCLCRFGDDP